MNIQPDRFLLIVLLLSGTQFAFAQQLFRYKNDEGVTVIENSIPAEFAKAGYQIIDINGAVLEEVAPSQHNAQEEVTILSRDDHILLASYSTEQEIFDRSMRIVDKLKADLRIIESDRQLLAEQLQKEQARRDQIVNAGHEVPEDVANMIAELEESDEKLNTQYRKREQDISQTLAEFEEKQERFARLIKISRNREDSADDQ